MTHLNVNGQALPYSGDPEMPLLWALRDLYHLFGTKYGCGMGLCGACTVHVDGVPTRSCQVTAAAVVGKKVTTIEGLDPSGQHPLQQAWCELDVSQCGYCQAGQIMSAAALLKTTPNPNDDQINAALSGNICRCGTQLRIRAAIKEAARKGVSP